MLQTQRNYIYENKHLFKYIGKSDNVIEYDDTDRRTNAVKNANDVKGTNVAKSMDTISAAEVENNSLPYFVVDFSKSYDWNKRHIGKIFSNNNSSKVPGIWIIEDSKEDIKSSEPSITYEVAQTKDILRECIACLKWLFLGKRDARKNIYSNYCKKVYTRYKYQQIYLIASRKTKAHHPTRLIFRQVTIEPCNEYRLLKEMCIAINREAYFWSPDPTQYEMILNILKDNNMDEEFIKLELNRKYIPHKRQRRKKCKAKSKMVEKIKK